MLFSALIIFAFALTSEEKCNYIRLDETEASIAEEKANRYPPRQKTMKHVPVYSQNGFGICYAASTAQVFDALQHLRGGDKRKSISPLSVAIGFRADPEHRRKYTRYVPEKNQVKYSFEGGGMCDVFNNSDHTEIGCLRNDIEHGIHQNLRQENLDALYYIFETFTIDGTVEKENISPYARSASGIVNRLRTCGVQPIESTIQNMTDLIRNSAEEASEFFNEYLHRNCQKERIRFKAQCENKYPGSKQETIELLHSHFDQKDPVLPLGVSFCQRFLTRHGSNFKGFTRQNGTRTYDEECGKHAALLIGRRWNSKTKSCQFLIRNSYGVSCERYLDEFKNDCDMGNIWVNEDTLSNNAYKFHVVKEQK